MLFVFFKDNSLAKLTMSDIFIKEHSIYVCDHLESQKIFDNVKNSWRENDDEAFDDTNQEDYRDLSKASHKCEVPAHKLPLVIEREFHFCHSLL